MLGKGEKKEEELRDETEPMNEKKLQRWINRLQGAKLIWILFLTNYQKYSVYEATKILNAE